MNNKKRTNKNKKKKSSFVKRIFGNRKLTILVVFVVMFAGVGAYLLNKSRAYDSNIESGQYNQLNSFRSSKGLPQLGSSECIARSARALAQQMADAHTIFHSNLTGYYCGGNSVGENVGMGPTPDSIFNAWVASPGHYANMVSTQFNSVGIGAVQGNDGKWYIVQGFSDCGCRDTVNIGPSNSGRLDTFVRGANNHLYHKYFTGYDWSGWEDLGGTLTSGPTVSSWASGRLDVFARDSSGYLMHKFWNGSVWSGWETFTEAKIASDPDAVSWGNGRIDIVARSSTNKLMHKWFENGWHNWETFTDGSIQSGPSIASWGPGRLDIFARGTTNEVFHKFYSYEGGWSGFENLGGQTYDSPDAVAVSPNYIHVFARGTNNQLYDKVFYGKWGNWESLGGGLTSSPTGASRGSGRVDVFGRGTDNAMWHRWNDGGGWSVWENLGGTLSSRPDAVSWH